MTNTIALRIAADIRDARDLAITDETFATIYRDRRPTPITTRPIPYIELRDIPAPRRA